MGARALHVELDDDLFTLEVDTSRFATDRLVETMLAAGGVQATLLAT